MKPAIKIGDRIIKKGDRPYFIADIGANHDGSIDRAYKLIELAKEAGADVAKFQNFKAEQIVSKKGFDAMPKQTHQANWTKSVFEVYKEASLKDEWSEKLFQKCTEVGIEYMTSPYDRNSVDLADKYSNAFKVGSGDITWIDLIEYIAKKNKPILLATGASSENDVERALYAINKYNDAVVLMQCNTNYTARQENFHYINLNVLKYYSQAYPKCILGLSDHTLGHTTVLGAVALGATVIEKHFTDDNNRIGPDHKFAMNPYTWKEMVASAMDLYDALGDGKKRVENNELQSIVVQQRALYTTRNLKKDSTLTVEDIFPLRPMQKGCIYPYEQNKVLGKRIIRDLEADYCISWEDIEDAER